MTQDRILTRFIEALGPRAGELGADNARKLVAWGFVDHCNFDVKAEQPLEPLHQLASALPERDLDNRTIHHGKGWAHDRKIVLDYARRAGLGVKSFVWCDRNTEVIKARVRLSDGTFSTLCVRVDTNRFWQEDEQ